jgi:serine/threonine protein kinase
MYICIYVCVYRSSRSSISGSVSSSTKAGELLAGCGDSHPESLGLSMPMDLKLKMARDCCAGVAFLHSKGLMHCDIKSLNFLVTRDFTVKLADLGEARPSHGVDKIDASVLPK